MHACQIDPTDTAPPCLGSPLRACVGTKGGTFWGRQPFCPHFSSATQVCRRCDYTLPSFWNRSGSRDLRPRWWIGCVSPKWTSLDRLLPPLLGCWQQVWHWVLGGGGYGPPLPLPRYLHLAAHCQSDKSSHLVPSFCAFKHNRDHSEEHFRPFSLQKVADSKHFHLNTSFQNPQNEVYDIKSWSHAQVW